MRHSLRFPLLVLQICAGLLTAYGTFAMISTAGTLPPNSVVVLGLVAAVASGLATARIAGNPYAGWWPSLAALAIPLLLVSLPYLAQVPCPPDHPPLTPTHTCVPPGATAFFGASTLGIVLAIWGAWMDVRRNFPRRPVPGSSGHAGNA